MPFLLSLFLFLNVWGVELQIPTLKSPVVDEAGFFSPQEKEDLENLAYEINTHKGPQITVLTVNDLQGYPIEEFSIRVAENWKLGLKEKGNGLLLIVSKAERKVRIEVGEGIEGDITDYEASLYIRNILTPAFKQGQFHSGIRMVMEEVAKKFGVSPEGEQRIVHRSQRPVEMAFPLLLPIMIVLLFITQISFRNHSMLRAISGGAGVAGAGLAILGTGGLLFLVILFVVGFVFGIIGFHNVLYALAQGSSHSGSYRGGSGGGFGGGGGWSGGGGGFSGGGSSGDW